MFFKYRAKIKPSSEPGRTVPIRARTPVTRVPIGLQGTRGGVRQIRGIRQIKPNRNVAITSVRGVANSTSISETKASLLKLATHVRIFEMEPMRWQ